MGTSVLTVVAWLANGLFYLLHSVLHVSTRVLLNICTHRSQQQVKSSAYIPFSLSFSPIIAPTFYPTMPTRSAYPSPCTFYSKQACAHKAPSPSTMYSINFFNVVTKVHTNVFRVNFQLIKIVENSVILFILGAKQTQTT